MSKINQDLQPVADMFRALRKGMGITITEASKMSEIARYQICNLENSKGNPSIQILTKYAKAYGMKISFTLESN